MELRTAQGDSGSMGTSSHFLHFVGQSYVVFFVYSGWPVGVLGMLASTVADGLAEFECAFTNYGRVVFSFFAPAYRKCEDETGKRR